MPAFFEPTAELPRGALISQCVCVRVCACVCVLKIVRSNSTVNSADEANMPLLLRVSQSWRDYFSIV